MYYSDDKEIIGNLQTIGVDPLDLEDIMEEVHMALGGNGWAYSSHGEDELADCREPLARVALLLWLARNQDTTGAHYIETFGDEND